MARASRPLWGLATILAPLVLPLPAPGQGVPPAVEDFGRWETLGSPVLSPDGGWIAYALSRNDESGELRLVAAAGEREWAFSDASGPVFSSNGHWIAFRIEPSAQERAESRREDRALRNDMGLMRLPPSGGVAGGATDPDTTRMARIQRFGFSGDGEHLAALRYPAGDEEDGLGGDLLVRELSGTDPVHFGNVKEFAWSPDGHLLAITVSASERVGNGVHLYDPESGRLRVLDSQPTSYGSLVWRDDAWDLAVLRARMDSAYVDTAYVALAWKRLDQGSSQPFLLGGEGSVGIPQGQAVVPYRTPLWSSDGSILFLGIQELDPKPDEEPEVTARDSSSVEIWHAADVDVIPRQKLMDRALREESRLVAWILDRDRIVPLEDELTEEVRVFESTRWALGLDGTPYEEEARFFPRRWDLYRVDIQTGEKLRIEEGVGYFYPGPAGRKLLFTEDETFWIRDVEGGEKVRVDSQIPRSLVNDVDDHPLKERRPWGVAGWTPQDRAVLLYDRYDVWEVDADGGGADRITRGAEDSVRHRYVWLDRDEDHIDLRDPQYFNLFGEWTKKSGYARWGGRGHATERLLLEDRSLSGLRRADDADVFVLRREAFDDSPDLFVAGPRLGDSRPLTETNPFQEDFAWGRAELVELDNPVSDARLQGILQYPAGYEAGKRYPMIVYIYERLSDQLHRYRVPSERSAYNPSVFTSQGYFVFMPDLTFRRRDPGFSALACVESAVRTVLARGDIDPERVGVMGHSWGGYEAAFFATHSDLFRAAIAGAPLTNLVSMYGMVYWNTGLPETSHYQWSQERMEVPLWEDPDAYLRNSTVMDFDHLDTPLLMAFGDEDGSVDWHQGIEAYNFARRLGKEFVLLVYRGENHSNRQRVNQVDYFHRQLEWFNHYLKGEPGPDWITRGVSWIDQENRRAGG